MARIPKLQRVSSQLRCHEDAFQPLLYNGGKSYAELSVQTYWARGLILIMTHRKYAGPFCVSKADDRLRLICDRRSRNTVELCWAKARLPRLGWPVLSCRAPPHVLRTCGRDLNDFYYILVVDAVRMEKHPCGPRVPPVLVRFLGRCVFGLGDGF